MRAAVTMVEVETEMVWVGDLAKAEALLSAIEGHDSADIELVTDCLLYTSPSPRDGLLSRMPSSA